MQGNEAIVTAWYRDNLADTVSRASSQAIAQIDGAVADLKSQIANADPVLTSAAIAPWFEHTLKRPPVSHDTPLFNVLQAAVEDLKTRLRSAGEKSAIESTAAPAGSRASEAPKPRS